MGKLADNLRDYFENTPKEQLDKDWEEIKPLNEIGVDVIDYSDYYKEWYEQKVQKESRRKLNCLGRKTVKGNNHGQTIPNRNI